MIDLSIRTGTETRPELLYKYPWPARSPDGRINIASVLDMQAWFHKSNMSSAELPVERLMDTSYLDYAVAKLPAWEIENRASQLPGCRK